MTDDNGKLGRKGSSGTRITVDLMTFDDTVRLICLEAGTPKPSTQLDTFVCVLPNDVNFTHRRLTDA